MMKTKLSLYIYFARIKVYKFLFHTQHFLTFLNQQIMVCFGFILFFGINFWVLRTMLYGVSSSSVSGAMMPLFAITSLIHIGICKYFFEQFNLFYKKNNFKVLWVQELRKLETSFLLKLGSHKTIHHPSSKKLL